MTDDRSSSNRATGEGRGSRQKKHCTNEGFGQGRGRNCNYRRTAGPADWRPQSLVAAVFDGLDKIIERSKKTIALLSSGNEPERRIGAGSKRSQLTGKKTGTPGDEPENTVKKITERR